MTLKNTDILSGYTKEGVAQKYFIYERGKTHEPIEVVLNYDIEKQIAYLKENFPCTEDYLLPIITTDASQKALYEHIINKRKKFNKHLKRMAQLMEFLEGLEDLFTNVIRHSFTMFIISNCILLSVKYLILTNARIGNDLEASFVRFVA